MNWPKAGRWAATAASLWWALLLDVLLGDGDGALMGWPLGWMGLAFGGAAGVAAGMGRHVVGRVVGSLAFTVLLWFAVEATHFYVLMPRYPVFHGVEQCNAPHMYPAATSRFGLRPSVNCWRAKWRIPQAGATPDTIFCHSLQTNAHGRRCVPQPSLPDTARSLLFLGDSFTMGEGVDDRHTLPAQTRRRLPQKAAYNYGVNGYGPHHTLQQLQQRNLPQELPHRPAAAIYTYIPQQAHRVAGTLRLLATGLGLQHPWYKLEDGGALRYLGRMHQRWQTAFWQWYGASPTVQYWQAYPPASEEAGLVLTAKLLQAIQQELQHQLGPSVAFYVVLYPGYETQLASYLPAGIRVIDLHEMNEPEGARIPHDGHPTPMGYARVAAAIAENLNP